MAPTKKQPKRPIVPTAIDPVKKSRVQKKQRNNGDSKKFGKIYGVEKVLGEPAAKGTGTSPYRLDKNKVCLALSGSLFFRAADFWGTDRASQTLKASRALLKHISSSSAKPAKPNLLHDKDDPNENAETIWLIAAMKKKITDKQKLKPASIRLPHALINLSTTASTTVCLIVKDPQRPYKDMVSTAGLNTTVTKVIGYSKLRTKIKSLQSRLQLCDSHKAFLADNRITALLPNVLGPDFYRKPSKVPIPVNLTGKQKTAENIKIQITKALSSTYFHLAPAENTSIRIGLSSFTPEQVAENIEKVVDQLTENIPGKWRGLRSLHIKTANSASLPIYMATETHADENGLVLPH
jgi:ribosome biogenesis protein UTP30